MERFLRQQEHVEQQGADHGDAGNQVVSNALTRPESASVSTARAGWRHKLYQAKTNELIGE